MTRALLATLSLVLSLSARADGKLCYDLLALQHPRFPAAAVAEYAKDGDFCGGNLHKTFGPSLKPVKEIIDTGGVVEWRTHLVNGPGLRNNRLGPYEPHHGLSVASYNALWERGGGKLRRVLFQDARAYCELFRPHPEIRLELSPTLEHNLSKKAFRRQALIVQAACPEAVVVDNPMGGVAHTRPYLVERHGEHAGKLSAPCQVSLDGDSAHDADTPKWLKRYEACDRFIWVPEFNMLSGLEDLFIDPRKRRHGPDKEELFLIFTPWD
jgi:hypothetical protein